MLGASIRPAVEIPAPIELQPNNIQQPFHLDHLRAASLLKGILFAYIKAQLSAIFV